MMNSSHVFLKTLAALAVIFTTVLAPFSYAQADNASIPSIQFLDKTYHLAWTSEPTPNYSKAEYLPEGEELPYYHNMLLVERVSGASVTDAVQAQVAFIQGLKKSKQAADGGKIIDLIEKPDTGEALLIFLLSAPDEEREVIWEWNAYRYSPAQTESDEQSVRLFGYSRRHYGNDNSIYDFLEEIDVDNPQSEAVNAVASAQIP